MKIVVYKDGSYKEIPGNVSYEYEQDSDWLVTIDMQSSVYVNVLRRWLEAFSRRRVLMKTDNEEDKNFLVKLARDTIKLVYGEVQEGGSDEHSTEHRPG